MHDACADPSSGSRVMALKLEGKAGGSDGVVRGYVRNQISRSGEAGVKATGKGLAWEPGSSSEAKVRATTGAI